MPIYSFQTRVEVTRPRRAPEQHELSFFVGSDTFPRNRLRTARAIAAEYDSTMYTGRFGAVQSASVKPDPRYEFQFVAKYENEPSPTLFRVVEYSLVPHDGRVKK